MTTTVSGVLLAGVPDPIAHSQGSPFALSADGLVTSSVGLRSNSTVLYAASTALGVFSGTVEYRVNPCKARKPLLSWSVVWARKEGRVLASFLERFVLSGLEMRTEKS